MNGGQSRRTVLQAVASSGVAIGLAGCTSSIPGMGGKSGRSGETEPCADVEAYIRATKEEDTETAVEYTPYEYTSEYTREEAKNIIEGEQGAIADVEVECENGDGLDEEAIEEIEGSFGDDKITAARTVTVTITSTVDESEETQETDLTMLEIDGDGWYIWFR